MWSYVFRDDPFSNSYQEEAMNKFRPINTVCARKSLGEGSLLGGLGRLVDGDLSVAKSITV